MAESAARSNHACCCPSINRASCALFLTLLVGGAACSVGYPSDAPPVFPPDLREKLRRPITSRLGVVPPCHPPLTRKSSISLPALSAFHRCRFRPRQHCSETLALMGRMEAISWSPLESSSMLTCRHWQSRSTLGQKAFGPGRLFIGLHFGYARAPQSKRHVYYLLRSPILCALPKWGDGLTSNERSANSASDGQPAAQGRWFSKPESFAHKPAGTPPSRAIP